MNTLVRSSHQWPDGSGITLGIGADLTYYIETWDSRGTTWCDDSVSDQLALNVYALFADDQYRRFVDESELTGHLCGDDETGELYLESSEIAYSMTFAGGMDDVSWRRLGELLESHDLADALRIVGWEKGT